MTTIFCTNKLAKFIGKVEQTPQTNLTVSTLGDWNGHLFFLDGKKCLMFVNNQTYYSIMLFCILKKDLKNLRAIFIERFIEQLTHDQLMEPDDPRRIKEDFGPLVLARTNNDKSTIGVMNEYIDAITHHCMVKYGHVSQMMPAYENGLINDTPMGTSSSAQKTIFPKEEMGKEDRGV